MTAYDGLKPRGVENKSTSLRHRARVFWPENSPASTCALVNGLNYVTVEMSQAQISARRKHELLHKNVFWELKTMRTGKHGTLITWKLSRMLFRTFHVQLLERDAGACVSDYSQLLFWKL